jgi:hypothetical protein
MYGGFIFGKLSEVQHWMRSVVFLEFHGDRLEAEAIRHHGAHQPLLARVCWIKLLDLRRTCLGTDHPATVRANVGLALALLAEGDRVSAEAIAASVAPIFAGERLWTDHERTLLMVGARELIVPFVDRLRPAASKPVARRWEQPQPPPASSVPRRVIHGDPQRLPGHADLELAIAAEIRGDLMAAIAALEKVVVSRQLELPPDHPAIIRTRIELVELNQSARPGSPEATAAIERYREAVERMRGVPRRRHEEYVRVHKALACQAAGDAEGARALIEHQQAAQREAAALRTMLSQRRDRTGALISSGDAALAAEVLADVLDQQLQLMPPDHPEILATRLLQAEAARATGHGNAARRLLEQVHAIRARDLGPEHRDTVQVRDLLADRAGNRGGH